MDGIENPKIDSAQAALTPEGIEFSLFPAGPVARAFAYGIDKVIQWVIIIGVVILANRLGAATGRWVFFLIMFVVDWFYHVIFELSCRGQSPGKRVMGLRVVRSDGSPVDPSSSFLRNLLRFADTFCFLFPIALISMITSPGFRRLGDWAGNTLVVYMPRALGFRQRENLAWLSSIAAVVPNEALSYGEKQAVLSFARRYPLLGESRANEIAEPYAEYLQISDNDSQSTETVPGEIKPSAAAYLLGIAHKLSGDYQTVKAEVKND